MTPLKHVTIIGGGTGIYPVTTALKQLPLDISTIIAVSDSGGSTGRIRDEFGFQPVGDLRQSLAALADGEGQEWIRKLLLYRFTKGTGLKGHNLGNLILTALQDMTGTTSEALFRAQQIFRIQGEVIPSANEVCDIEITYLDGSVLVGEDYLNPESAIDKKVSSITLVPEATLNPYAREAIVKSDAIIIGPGDYYGSILSTILPKGTVEAFAETKARIIYIVNLMTRHHQTDEMQATDHVKGIEATIGRPVDAIIMNSQQVPPSVREAYAQDHEHLVVDDLGDDPRVVRAEVLADAQVTTSEGDQLHRSYLRHDSHKLMNVLSQQLDLPT